MTNLAPSEARRIIENLRHNQTKEHGISILEEKYLAALEIALTVLEQQEKGEMDIIRIRELLKNNQTDTYRQIENDGWIEWGGGDCPISEKDTVEVLSRNGKKATLSRAHTWDWTHIDSGSDIIAYRVIENDGREG